LKPTPGAGAPENVVSPDAAVLIVADLSDSKRAIDRVSP
jgi:hypothetical protein